MKRIWQAIVYALGAFDWPLLALLLLMTGLGMTVMHSAVGGTDWRFADQLRNFALAFAAMWGVALIPHTWLRRLALPAYLGGVVLLIGVEFVGETAKGATRWLNLGLVRLQPSEFMKIAVPMMLAWMFHQRRGRLQLLDFVLASALLLVPFLLIVRQPDLGTALLVFAAGFCVIYFGGLSFRLLIPVVVVLVVGIAALIYYEPQICQSTMNWPWLHDYQKHRICTLLDPTTDPLGKGFHTIQAMIAVGSGGIYGKGYLQGTQSHLDFVPERTTDFIFAVFAEEFGLYGGVMLLVLYALLVLRGLNIALQAQTLFARLLAGSLSMMFFVYVFVNIGMVTGMLPVVGVPLPLMSYGGTALLTLGVANGILMNISHHRVVRR